MGSIQIGIENGLHDSPQDSKKIDHGRRLLPQVVDELALSDPDHIVGMMAKSVDISQGFDNLTILQLSKAINYMAHYFDRLLGKVPEGTFIPMAFIGLQDFRYTAMELAAIKTSHPLLIPSTRNALSNTVSLINTTGAKTLFYSGKGPLEEQALALQKLVPGLAVYEIPTIEEMYTTAAPSYPYTKTFEEAKDDRIIIVHTSGSTGHPKPIYYTNQWIRRCDSDPHSPPVEGRVRGDLMLLGRKKLHFTATPFFHLSGIGIGFTPLLFQTTLVMGPATVPASGKLAFEIAKHVKLSGLITVPSLCDALFADHGEELKPYLSDLEYVLWLGGPLAKSTGDWITTQTNALLWQIYGSTEMGWVPMLVPDRSHWQYLEFHPEIGPTLERIHPESDLYEIVMKRHPNPEFAWSRPVFDLFPDHKEWRSRDLIKRCEDPGFEHLWMYQGRVDDMMVMHNGLKVNPVDIEIMLQVHPALNGCLVVGAGYTQCGMLLEPKDYELEKEKLVELVWPSVERANETVPEHARVQKELIIVGTKDRPFPRAAKGTIVRSMTVGLYGEEIKDIYSGLSSSVKSGIQSNE